MKRQSSGHPCIKRSLQNEGIRYITGKHLVTFRENTPQRCIKHITPLTGQTHVKINILFWLKWKTEKSLTNPWRASQTCLTQSHLDIMGLLYSQQPASPTVAKQFDIHKLWETWTEMDNNFAWVAQTAYYNVETKQHLKKKKLLSHRFHVT